MDTFDMQIHPEEFGDEMDYYADYEMEDQWIDAAYEDRYACYDYEY